jgi:hypothetical protein
MIEMWRPHFKIEKLLLCYIPQKKYARMLQA